MCTSTRKSKSSKAYMVKLFHMFTPPVMVPVEKGERVCSVREREGGWRGWRGWVSKGVLVYVSVREGVK